jgi:prepilin-type N-terminal cleavage/methylation domain-containing protein
MNRNISGFTLKELLIVLTIIGSLVAVVVPRLQDARTEGLETKTKAELSLVGKRAAVEESLALTFDVVCGTNGFSQAQSIADQISAVETFIGETVTCNSRTGGYAVAILVASSTYWCVDSAGQRLERPTDLGVAEYGCD